MRYRHSTVAEKAYAEKSYLFPNYASPQNGFENLATKYPQKQKQRHFKNQKCNKSGPIPYVNAK